MKHHTLANVVWKEGNFYVAQCLNIDVSSFGETKAEALENLNEALMLYLEDITPDEPFQTVEKPEIVNLSIYA
jgi:predicted RNase H-like HicB family nuclease